MHTRQRKDCKQEADLSTTRESPPNSIFNSYHDVAYSVKANQIPARLLNTDNLPTDRTSGSDSYFLLS